MGKLGAYVYIILDNYILICYNCLHNYTQKGGSLKNYIDFRLYETDMIYLLNCIMLSKKILQEGDSRVFSHFFNKKDYFTYIYDLTNLQKLISYQANRELYNYDNNEILVSHQYWLNQKDKSFNFLKGKERIKMLKNIEKEINELKQVENSRILRQEILSSLDLGTFGRKFYKKFTFSTKSIDKRKVV